MIIREIERIVNEKIKILKGFNAFRTKKPGKYPELNPVYVPSVELKKKMEVHTDLDKLPEDLFKRRAPYEDDRQFDYRKDNFEPVTMPYFMKALGKLNRIFNPSNYSITWNKEDSAERAYFNKEIPLYGSIDKYFKQIVLVNKICDPNALLVVKPYYLPTKEEERDGEMVLVYDQSDRIEVVPCIVDCEKVIDFVDGKFAMILLNEKSLVKEGDKEIPEGKIFEFYDTENIYRITQIGKKSDWKFTDPDIYYTHALGYLPCQRLKGIPKTKDNRTYYQSYFVSAVPQLDTALYGHSNLDMSMTTQMFPQRVEYVDRCTEPGCDDGFLRDVIDGKERKTKCSRCNGAGTLSRTGPMMVKHFTRPDTFAADAGTAQEVPFPGVAYVAPDPAVLEFCYTKFKNDATDAFSFINLDVSNSDVKGSETALGKQIDREELFSFIMGISDEIFDLLSFTIKACGLMRYGESFEVPVVSAPTSFAIRDEYELTEELIEAKKANVPDVAFREIVKEYMAKRFSSYSNVDDIVNLIFAIDGLVTYSQTEINSMLASQTALKWEVILHNRISSFIEEIMSTDDEFFTKDYDVQKQTLVDMAQKLTAEIEASAPGSAATIIKIGNSAA